MRFAAFFGALLVASMALAQSLPPPVDDRAATAIDLWMSALTRVEGSVEGGGTYNAWLDRGAPVSVIERRPGAAGETTVGFYFDRADLIRFRQDGAGDSLVIDFAGGRAIGARRSVNGVLMPVTPEEISSALAQAQTARQRIAARTGVTPAARPGPGSFGLFVPSAGTSGPVDYRRPRVAEADWLNRIAAFLPAMNRCLDLYGGTGMQIAQAWPVGPRVGVRLVGSDGGRVDCVADADGSRSVLLAALAVDAPLGPGEGAVVYTPPGRSPPGGDCFVRAATPVGAPGTVTTRRC